MRARQIQIALLLSVLIFSAASIPLAAQGASGIVGKITLGRAPQASGTVVAYHLASGEVFRAPIGPEGEFAIPGLEGGYYDIAVETDDGLYVANQVVNVPPGGTATVKYDLSKSVGLSDGPRPFPGSDKQATGIARLTSGGGKAGPGMNGKKLATWGTVGGIAAVVLLSGSSSSGSSSPTMP